MSDRGNFAERVAEASRKLTGRSGKDDTLLGIAEAAVELVSGCDVAAVCVLRHGRHDTCAHTDSSVQQLDDLQRELGEGPSITELNSMDVIYVPDLMAPLPWPNWGKKVAGEAGIRSYLGFRLFTDADSIGTLNLYAYEIDAFSYQDRLDGMVVAAHSAVALDSSVEKEQLHTALTSRQLIGEATGMLRVQYSLTTEQAFGVLKRISSEQNIKLFSVAEQVVETGSLPGSPV
ncbi:ANTAR domain-containing protein [Nocardioides exalbidus]|uniref:ANTAR domain-containing protein n=2 Tax=Nocardioides exalbidus TaxID=402596 RepID=A0A1H4Y9C5_9ACTN|nr:ANTAR domain-containing protein [Nocardioides exalbidus]